MEADTALALPSAEGRAMNMNVQVLGPVEVACGNGAVGLGGPKPRALLAMLALEAGSTVSTDRLTDGLWGEEPPATSAKLIQVYVSHLRKALAAAGADGVIVTRGHGYELAVDRAQVDATRFERLLAQGAAREALALWRGSPLSDVSLEPFAAAEIRRLTELRAAALEVAIDQDLAAGRHREVLPELESLLGQEPLRERLHAQRILALYRCGRQADALDAYRQARTTLINDVGVEPGPELRSLHDAILRQDAAIAAPAADRLAELAVRTSQERAAWRIAEDDFAAGVVELQDQQQRAAARTTVAGPPFKGLESFDVDDAAIFFGRERLVAEMVARLPGSRMFGVIGASGSGKSSLLRAGLLAALAAGALPGSAEWVTRIMRPGARPTRVLDDAVGTLPAGVSAVLVVDQFEEIFTVGADAAERERFIADVVALARDHRRRTLVIIAVRSDFYGYCAHYPRLSSMVDANSVLVGPMRADELRRAIELPAQAAGISVEPELVSALIADVEGQPGALPLLSTALFELWDNAVRWQDEGERWLRLVTYQQAGGVQGAVARLAETVYTALDAEQQQRARRLLLRLAGDGDVRLRVPRAELAGFEDVIAELSADRLLTADEDHVEVAHEAVLREWPRLVHWLEEDAEGRRLHRHLTTTARDWAASGRDASDLYRGSRLAAAAEWVSAHRDDLNDVERDFVDASLAAGQADTEAQRRTNRRLRVLLSGVAGLLVLALVAGGVAFWQRSRAEQVAIIADARRLGAEALTRERLDEALLLARAGVELHPTHETHGSLLSVLLRQPASVGELRGDGWALTSADVSDDGTMVATADERGTVSVYDLRTRKRVSEPYRVFGGLVQNVVFSPDGRTVAATINGSGLFVDLVDARTGTRRDRFELPQYRIPPGGGPFEYFTVMTTAFHPNGRDLIVQQSDAAFFFGETAEGLPGGGPPMLTRLDGETGEELVSRRVGRSNAAFFSATADGRQIFVSSPGDNATYEIDPNTLRVRHTYGVGDDFSAISPDGSRLALGSMDGTVRVVDLPSGDARTMAGSHADGSDMFLAFTPDGRTLTSTAGGGELIVWDVAGSQIRERIDDKEAIWGLHVSPDGRTLFTASNDGRVAMWDLAGDRRLDQRFDAGPPLDLEDTSPKGLAVSPDGSVVAVSQPDGIDVLDARTLKRRARLRPTEVALALAFSADGRLASSGQGGELTIWDVTRAGPIQHLEGLPGTTSQSLAFTPDGEHLMVANYGSDGNRYPGGVRRYDIATGEETPFRFVIEAASVALSPDGRLVAAASVETPAQVREVRTGEAVATLDVGDVARTVAFSPDGKLLALGLFGGSAILLSTDDYQQFGRRMATQTGRVTALQFSPDGRRLLTGSVDGTVQLWDVATQQAIGAPLGVNADAYMAAAFTPDGNHIIAVPHEGQGVRWDVREASWRKHGCAVAGRQLTAEEWRLELPDRPYRAVCPQHR